MVFETFGEVDAPFGGGANQVNSTAGRFWFQPRRVQEDPARRSLADYSGLASARRDPRLFISQFRMFEFGSLALTRNPKLKPEAVYLDPQARRNIRGLPPDLAATDRTRKQLRRIEPAVGIEDPTHSRHCFEIGFGE